MKKIVLLSLVFVVTLLASVAVSAHHSPASCLVNGTLLNGTTGSHTMDGVTYAVTLDSVQNVNNSLTPFFTIGPSNASFATTISFPSPISTQTLNNGVELYVDTVTQNINAAGITTWGRANFCLSPPLPLNSSTSSSFCIDSDGVNPLVPGVCEDNHNRYYDYCVGDDVVEFSCQGPPGQETCAIANNRTVNMCNSAANASNTTFICRGQDHTGVFTAPASVCKPASNTFVVPTFTLTLEEGWNMVSLPYFGNGQQYLLNDGCQLGSLPSYTFNTAAQNYVRSNPLEGNTPHFVLKTGGSCSTSFGFNTYLTVGTNTLATGLNMIPGGDTVEPFSQFFSRSTCNFINRPLWYNTTTSVYQAATHREPGKSYWLRAQLHCTATL